MPCSHMHLVSIAAPLVVSFEREIYNVTETDEQVEVCVILTSPDSGIFEEVVGAEVFEDDMVKTNIHIPSDAAIASEL